MIILRIDSVPSSALFRKYGNGDLQSEYSWQRENQNGFSSGN